MTEKPKPYESVLALARKLAAVADPANGATPGERENAAAKLAKLCEDHNLSPDRLDPAKRKPRELVVVTRWYGQDQPPKRDAKLAEFAIRCLWNVVGEMREAHRVRDDVEMPTRGMAVKLRQCYSIRAECTDLEYSEWKDMWDHFAPYMYDHLQELRAEASQAKHALKMGVPTFCAKNEISLPPEARAKDAPPSIATIGALLSTKRAPAMHKGKSLAASNLIS